MEEIYLLGVDVGTSSIKVTVIDQEARFVAQESAAYRLINPNQVSIQIDTAACQKTPPVARFFWYNREKGD